MHIMCIPWLYIIVLMSFPEMGVSARMGFTPGPLSFQTFFKLWNPRTQWVDQWRFLDGKVMGKSSMNPGCSVAMLDCRRVKKKNKTKWPVFSCKTDEQRWDLGVFFGQTQIRPFSARHMLLGPQTHCHHRHRQSPALNRVCLQSATKRVGGHSKLQRSSFLCGFGWYPGNYIKWSLQKDVLRCAPLRRRSHLQFFPRVSYAINVYKRTIVKTIGKNHREKP